MREQNKAASAAFFVRSGHRTTPSMRATYPTGPDPVDPAALATTASWRVTKQLGLVLLCFAWVALGLLGRSPWKTEDAVTFAIAWEMLQRHDWLVPYVAQEITLSAAPLVPWLAATGIALFAPLIDAPDAARLAVGLLLVLLLVFTGLAGRALNDRSMYWMPVLLVVGAVGLFDRSHQLSGELALAASVALALLGVALMPTAPVRGGAALGVGVGVGFLAAGWLGPLWTLAPALLLPSFGSPWRTRVYAAGLGVALLVALPIASAWPWALHARSPELFGAWAGTETLASYFAFLPGAGSPNPGWLARNIVWVAWPAVPLIAWMLWIRGRGFNGGLAQPGVVVPGVFALWMLGMLATMPDARLMQLLPLIAPFALLGSLEIDSMRRGDSAALDWFGILTFGLIAIALWAFWLDAYFNGMSARVALFLRDTETGYGTSIHLRTIVPALLLTVLWIVLVRPARRSNRRVILNWAAGMTLIWGLIATIWLPYIDARRTYEPIGEAIGLYRPQNACIARRDVGPAQRALFYYVAGIVTIPEEAPSAGQCPALLVQYGRLPEGTPELDGYAIAWQGSRRGDSSERFVLYRKNPE
jgi:4-amino-4-deoxy-L-arabinose transferase-like glycosyltransferase